MNKTASHPIFKRVQPITLALLGLSLMLTTACSTKQATSKHDPYEGFNRASYTFNTTLDKYTLKPIAKAYDFVVPEPVDTGVDNVLSNLNDVNVVTNGLLQFNTQQASSDMGRLLINSTLGLAGLFDVAKYMGMPKHNEDFGQTLAVWGVPSGPYLMVPFLGPKTMRSFAGTPVDSLIEGLTTEAVGITSNKDKLIYQGVKLVNTRQNLLPLEKKLEGSGLDPYIAIRENYIAHRAMLANNGVPTSQSAEDEYGDDSFGDEDEFEEAF